MAQLLRRATRKLGKTVVLVLHAGAHRRSGAAETIITGEVPSSVYQLSLRVGLTNGRRISTYN